MHIRFTWMVASLALLAMGFLLACSTKYSEANNGLVVVPSQGSAVMQSFSLDLSNGHTSQINDAAGPPTSGLPASVILDPAGSYAYVIVYQNAALTTSVTGIQSFQIASDGKLSAVNSTVPLTNPVAMAIDSGGKFLFVANGSEGTISVFSVSSGGNLTEVSGSPFHLAVPTGGTAPSASALAVTPTAYPVQFASCSGVTPPTTENLFITDSVNYVVLNYSVSSSGSLTIVPSATNTGVATGAVPSGVAVDPCNRFVYVSNAGQGSNANTVSAYTMCSAVVPGNNCPVADFSLQPVAGSPFAAGDSPGPLAVEPFGNFLYVVDTGSNELSSFRIAQVTGALSPLTPATVATNSGSNSIAIRSDGNWIFVANTNSATVSEYAITPASGNLTPQTPITTFNYPSGVAVK